MIQPSTNVIHVFPGSDRTLHGTLLDSLRSLINQGDLAPGSRVPERTLCQKFSVSRTPLREALKVLAAEGHGLPRWTR
jgi:DNA-binding GntR family transcriptional regulator